MDSQIQTIKVNGAEITPEQIIEEVQKHPMAQVNPAQAMSETARALVIRTLLLEQADKKGISADDEAAKELPETAQDYERRIHVLLTSEVKATEVDDATCLDFYEKNKDALKNPEMAEASHILFKNAEGVEKAELFQKAEDIIAHLKDNPDEFAAMAEEYSDCPSKSEGGNLGQLNRGQTVPEFENAMFALEVGQTTEEPVESSFGYHIIKLHNKVPGQLLPFEVMQEQIAQYIKVNTWQAEVSKYIESLVENSAIEGIQMVAPQQEEQAS